MLGVVGNASDGGDAEGLGGADHVFDLVEVGGAVLAVDHHEVVAERAEDLHHVGGVAGDDGAEDDFAFVEFGLCGVGSHGRVPLLSSLPALSPALPLRGRGPDFTPALCA